MELGEQVVEPGYSAVHQLEVEGGVAQRHRAAQHQPRQRPDHRDGDEDKEQRQQAAELWR